jgi:RHS repeat-associated protein
MMCYATTCSAATTYGPFGNTTSETGVLAADNVYRFSTKYYDSETELSYYGVRYYDAELGRWLNRDPVGKDGGLNVYGFGSTYNKNTSYFDEFKY